MTVTNNPKIDAAPPRDFTYIKPRRRRLSEYEAVTCYTQPDPSAFDREGWFLRTPEGKTAWRRESTRLVHPHWFDFRDPAAIWQRTYVRMQAEQERAIERATADAVESGAIGDVDPSWCQELLAGHYRAWSFFEYGLFRAFAPAQRDALSDTIGNALCFEGVDKVRHAQAVVLYLLELEHVVDGLSDKGAKERWLDDPAYQPSRAVCEQLMLETEDWAELAVAVNLVVDPIVSEVSVSQLLRRFAPFHGDYVTPLIVSTVERDRRRNRAWTEELVRMVLGETKPDRLTGMETSEGRPVSEHNRDVIQSWLDRWTPRALEAAAALSPVYDLPPLQVARHEEVLARVRAGQSQLVEALGFQPWTDGGDSE
jgi:hypothetical protein